MDYKSEYKNWLEKVKDRAKAKGFYVSVTAKDRLMTREVEAIIVKDIEQKLQ